MSYALLRGAILSVALVATVISGCSSDDDDMTDAVAGSDSTAVDDAVAGSDSTAIDGFIVMDSARPVGEAMGALQLALDGNEAITALPLIDHQANASAIGETLRPTAVQLFGNPALGTPLMKVNQLAGLDLPQKILAWEDAEGLSHLGYNSADYLQQRYAIEGDESAVAALESIGNALNTLTTNASGNTANEASDDEAAAAMTTVSAGEGIVQITSTRNMETTYSELVTAVQNSEALQLVAQLDHSANARNVDLELDPTRLLVFGNPNAGTPLMQAEQTIGIDLPQKMLVFQNTDGVVTIAYNNPVYLAARHGIIGQEDRLTAISDVLAGLANNAAGIIPAE